MRRCCDPQLKMVKLLNFTAQHSSILPPHECLVDGFPQLEDVIADGQVVLQPERRQHHAVADGEGEPQLVLVPWLHGPASPHLRLEVLQVADVWLDVRPHRPGWHIWGYGGSWCDGRRGVGRQRRMRVIGVHLVLETAKLRKCSYTIFVKLTFKDATCISKCWLKKTVLLLSTLICFNKNTKIISGLVKITKGKPRPKKPVA